MADSDLTLIDACIEGDLDAVRAALASDPEMVNAQDDLLGSTPLIFATHRGYTKIVDALLGAGADVNLRERASNTTPLHWAAEAGHPQIARRLLQRGAEIDAKDDWFQLAPVGWATVVNWEPKFRNDRAGTLKLLFDHGARVDPFSAILAGDATALRKLGPEAMTERTGFAGQARQPLHAASARGLAPMVEVCLELGADPSALNHFGMSPLAEAFGHGHRDCAELLADHADLSAAVFASEFEIAEDMPLKEGHASLLHGVTTAGSLAAVKFLLGRKFDPNHHLKHLAGELPCTATPLHLAAEAGHLEIARALIDAGADVNARSGETSQTPLHFAARAGQVEMAKLLLVHGADPAIRDGVFDSTPGEWADQCELDDFASLFRS
ncbi:MAG TPA: ankyrin repeat domain-containing protein [Bryobacteraceae bacterium]|nr:ankyrin repeat domain-containing protein [Bryobacteraceae bacterium]